MDETQSAGGPWANARAGRRSAKGRSCEGRLTKGDSPKGQGTIGR